MAAAAAAALGDTEGHQRHFIKNSFKVTVKASLQQGGLCCFPLTSHQIASYLIDQKPGAACVCVRKPAILTHLVGLPQLLSHAPHLGQEVAQQEGPEEAAAATQCQQLFRHRVSRLYLQMERRLLEQQWVGWDKKEPVREARY